MGSNESSSDSFNPANVAKSVFVGNRDHLLAEARSELMKQEYKVESLNTCISELQQQTLSGWTWRTPISNMQNLEESKFDNRKNWS